VADHFKISWSVLPPYPYATELFLGIVLKYFGIHGLNLTFGIIAVLNIYVTYLFFRELDISKRISRLALIIFIGSPTFLEIAFWEFKVEMFLSAVVMASFFVFLRILKKWDYPQIILLGFLGALAILIKITSSPIVFSELFLISFFLFSKTTKRQWILMLITYGMSFLFPLLIWTRYEGIRLTPSLAIANNFHLISASPTNQWAVDANIVETCTAQTHQLDIGRYFPNSTLWDKLAQPFAYILSIRSYYHLPYYQKEDPGPFIYAGIFIFVCLPFIWKRTRTFPFIGFYIIGTAFIAFFYIFVGTIFWYLFPIFPLIALSIPLVANGVKIRSVDRKFTERIILSFACINFLYMILMAPARINMAHSINDLANTDTAFIRDIYLHNTYINQNTTGSLILDTTEFPFTVLLPFVDDADTRIIYSNYYFAAANKSLADMYNELTAKGIGYVIANKLPTTTPWYTGCVARNRDILVDFLDRYTIPLYPDTDPTIYKLTGSQRYE
jgi:hypothetical protein